MFILGLKYFRLSFSHFKSRIPILLTIIGLSISIGCLIASIALMRGFQAETMNKMLHIHGHARIYGVHNKLLQDQNSRYHERYVHKIDTHGVTGYADPTTLSITFLNDDDIRFVLQNYMKNTEQRSVSALANASNTIYIGHRLADELCIQPGDSMMIMFDINSGRRFKYIVAGIFKIGFYEFDRYQVFMPRSTYHEDLMLFKEQSTIVYIDNPQHINQYRDHMCTTNPSVHIETWQEIYKSISDMFKVHARGISLLIGLFILAGIIQSVTNIFTLMTNSAKDFSILENIGMSPIQKWTLIFTYAMCINICNVICGVISGLLICYSYIYLRNFLEMHHIYIIDQDAFWISRFNPQIMMYDIIIISGCALLIMTLTSIIATYAITRRSMFTWMRE